MMKKSKCSVCNKSFDTGKKYLKCAVCEYKCHVSCETAAQPSCTAVPLKAVINLRPLLSILLTDQQKPSKSDLDYMTPSMKLSIP